MLSRGSMLRNEPSIDFPWWKVRLRAAGRGGGYSPWRGLFESLLRVVYRGDWPARLWSFVPGAHEVVVARYRLDLPAGTGRPLRVAFVSDLHAGPTTPEPVLRAGFEAVRAANPDVLLLGGDYVFLDAEPQRLALIEDLVASVGCPTKLAVLGNHDLWACDPAIANALARGGARVLVNESIRLPEPWSDVAVIGLDDPGTGICDSAGAAAQLDGQPFRIVLCHSPDGLLHLSGERFDVFLAGHTHGGQVAAPWGPVVLPHGALCRQFSAGPATLNGGWICVSRGLGGVEVPVRTFAPPDIVVLELSRKNQLE